MARLSLTDPWRAFSKKKTLEIHFNLPPSCNSPPAASFFISHLLCPYSLLCFKAQGLLPTYPGLPSSEYPWSGVDTLRTLPIYTLSYIYCLVLLRAQAHCSKQMKVFIHSRYHVWILKRAYSLKIVDFIEMLDASVTEAEFLDKTESLCLVGTKLISYHLSISMRQKRQSLKGWALPEFIVSSLISYVTKWKLVKLVMLNKVTYLIGLS